MQIPYKNKLDNIITELSVFLERDFSSRFRNLTNKEDRQLFFLAKILTQLKHISGQIKEDEKIVIFPRKEASSKLL